MYREFLKPGMEQKVLEVVDLLRNSGNAELYQKILDEMDQEPWTDEWIKNGEGGQPVEPRLRLAEPDGRPDDSINEEALSNPFFLRFPASMELSERIRWM